MKPPKYLNFEVQNSDFQPNLGKELDDKNLADQFSCMPMMKQELEILGFVTAQVTKLRWFKILITLYFLMEWTFKFTSKFLSFGCHFAKNCGTLLYSNTRNAILIPFDSISSLLSTLWSSDILIYTCKYQIWFRADSIKNNAVQRWSRLNFSFLNSPDSAKFRAGQFTKRVDQPWKTPNFWSRAVQHWVSVRLQPGLLDIHVMSFYFLNGVNFIFESPFIQCIKVPRFQSYVAFFCVDNLRENLIRCLFESSFDRGDSRRHFSKLSVVPEIYLWRLLWHCRHPWTHVFLTTTHLREARVKILVEIVLK